MEMKLRFIAMSSNSNWVYVGILLVVCGLRSSACCLLFIACFLLRRAKMSQPGRLEAQLNFLSRYQGYLSSIVVLGTPVFIQL